MNNPKTGNMQISLHSKIIANTCMEQTFVFALISMRFPVKLNFSYPNFISALKFNVIRRSDNSINIANEHAMVM